MLALGIYANRSYAVLPFFNGDCLALLALEVKMRWAKFAVHTGCSCTLLGRSSRTRREPHFLHHTRRYFHNQDNIPVFRRPRLALAHFGWFP
jgi:hypothetical protein